MQSTQQQFAAQKKVKNKWVVQQKPSPAVVPSVNSPVEKILHLQRTIGNPVVQRLIESGTIQAKLRIGQPNDAYEMEADRLADRVMRMPAPDMPVQSPGVTPGIESSINSLKGGGQPLSPSTRAYFEPRFGTDFSHVRVHTGARAVQTAGAINAKAYTVGNNIVFNHSEYSPGTTSGKTLLAHELTHTIQQNSSQIRQKGYNGLSDNIIQRRFEPENASEAMVGQLFVLSEPYLVIGFGGSFAHLYKGDIVKVLRWENNRDFVTAIQYFNFRLNNNGSFFSVPKYLLRPYKPANTGDLAYYGTEIDQQAASIKRGRKDLDNAQNITGSLGQEERSRIQGLQQTRQRELNKKLIQEVMFNRFDGIIVKWVDYYNRQFNYPGNDALDPNLVKSMLFEESQLGTSGEFLIPGSQVRNEYNLGQVIDSYPSALLIMMNEMQPSLIPDYHLENIDRDRIAAQNEFQNLRSSNNLSGEEQIRLEYLKMIDELPGNFAPNYMLYYRAPGQQYGFGNALMDFFQSVGAWQLHRNLTYEFWIRTSIRWLFEKRQHGNVHSWQDAIRAYNGSGPKAQNYRNRVTGRARAATAAQDAGKEYVPSNI